MPTPRIHYYIDGDNAACGKEADGGDNFSDDIDDITCKRCIARADDYDEEMEGLDNEDTDEEAADQSKTIFTLAPSTLDKGNTKELESIVYYKNNSEKDNPIRMRKVLISESEYDSQMKYYTKPTPYHVFSEESRVEKYVETMGLIKSTHNGESTMTAPRNTRNTETPKTPTTPAVPAPKALTLQEKIEAQKAAAQSTPPVAPPPNTPAPRLPVSEKEAESKEPTLARLCKLETTVENIRHNFESHKPISRITALEEEILKDKEIIAAQQNTIDAMLTKLAECEQAILDYCVSTMSETPAVQAPAPRTPAPRTPAPRTAPLSDEEGMAMFELYDNGRGLKMNVIAEQYNLDDPKGNGGKMVWNAINKVRKALA